MKAAALMMSLGVLALTFPALAAGDAEVLVLKMENDRSGFWKHAAWQPVAARPGDTGIAAVAAYFAPQG